MIAHQADFGRFLKLLRREPTDRPVLFELYMNQPLYELVNGEKMRDGSPLGKARFVARAYHKMGYDFSTIYASAFHFTEDFHTIRTRSLNANAGLVDERSFEAFAWPDPEQFDSGILKEIEKDLPEGMKLMVMGPGGILENVTALCGYENLCYLVYDEPDLVQRLFDEVGKRLLKYYEIALQYDSVGLISSNDDWGFNTQLFMNTDMMRRYVLPWHRRIVDLCHAAGRPVLLHSCGNLAAVMEDVINMGYDAKHSFEDKILPIEDAYEAYKGRIALLGGLDMNWLCASSPEMVYERTLSMLERSRDAGGWAVGTGNSVPDYLPNASLFAMQRAARDFA